MSTLQLSMRQDHRVGEKLFIDFSGDGSKAVLFVATLGASSYTTWSRC